MGFFFLFVLQDSHDKTTANFDISTKSICFGENNFLYYYFTNGSQIEIIFY